jgi:hypothetical protein
MIAIAKEAAVSLFVSQISVETDELKPSTRKPPRNQAW